MNKNNLNCDIVKDLLPLYHDKVVSDTTAMAVEEHLDGCEDCSKEYDTLSTELSTKLKSEKKGVKDLLKIIKHKGLIKGITIAVVCVAVLLSSFFVLTQVPLVTMSEKQISAMHVYKYNGAFFMLYDHQMVSYGYSYGVEDTDSKNNETYNIVCKRPVLELHPSEKRVVVADWFSKTKVNENINKITLNGKVIWTEQENGNDKVPDYVKEYIDYFDSENYSNYEKDEDYIGISSCDFDFNRVIFTYSDGSSKVWDIDGNLISDSSVNE